MALISVACFLFVYVPGFVLATNSHVVLLTNDCLGLVGRTSGITCTDHITVLYNITTVIYCKVIYNYERRLILIIAIARG